AAAEPGRVAARNRGGVSEIPGRDGNDLARARHRRRRYTRARRRYHAFCFDGYRRDRGRAGSLRSESRTVEGESRAAAGARRSARLDPAHARAGIFQRTALARELREFLYRKWNRFGSRIWRSERSRRVEYFA